MIGGGETGRRAPLVAALVGLALVCVTGCSRRAHGPDAWATFVAAQHQQADQRLDAGDAAGARQALLELLQARRPAGDHRLALQDTYFRLCRLALDRHQPREALAFADQGLAQGMTPHLFVANLLVARAAAEERLGQPRGAANDYHRALLMNEALSAQMRNRP